VKPEEAMMQILGIDIGGSGIKGALVEVETGALATERYRLATPQPAAPEPVARVVAEVAGQFAWRGPIGCTFPAVIKDGVAYSAANVARAWIGRDGQALFAAATGCPVRLLNDADAAGIAEMTFGAGRGQSGLVMIVTLGTGIGTALFYRGVLVPNTELGHIEIRGKDAERRASDRARVRKRLSWERWARRVDEYLGRLEALFSPDLFIIGGGVSREHARFLPRLTVRTPLVPAHLRNEAGIVGAALAAADLTSVP
jgi:polyphosphate glucokinase